MTDGKRVACFFTAGYTELNSMKMFLSKINNQVEYIQLCPNAPRKSRTNIENRRKKTSIDANQNGLTGRALIDFVVKTVSKSYFKEEVYDAILIEDDKDARFLNIKEDGTADIDKQNWEAHKTEVIARLQQECPDIPVIFIYAAPEIESWFVADWDNSFGEQYKNIFQTEQDHQFFRTQFRKYVRQTVLTKRYENALESYGYFENVYKKLSVELENALMSEGFVDPNLSKRQKPNKIVNYSKRIHGALMLETIDPYAVMRNCSYFLAEGIRTLEQL